MDDEQPIKREFTGTWACVELHDLVNNRKINRDEAWLAMQIDSFYQTGKGCFAGDKALGKMVGLEWRATAKWVAHLKSVGVLKVIRKGNQRILVPIWRWGWYRQQRGNRCTIVHPRPLTDARSCIQPMHDRASYTTQYNTTVRPAIAGADGQTKLASLNGTRWHRMASALAAAIAQVRKVNYTSKALQWAQQFQRLHVQDGVPTTRIRRALEWYCRELPKRYRDQFFLVIQSGDAFRRKFIQLESAIARDVAERSEGDSSSAGPGTVRIVATVVGHRHID